MKVSNLMELMGVFQNSPKNKLFTLWGGEVCPCDVSKYASAEKIYVL
jgi:hypothetical protein